MTLYKFECKCGSELVLGKKTRPVCRACGKQMMLEGKITKRVSRIAIRSFNHVYGTMTKVARSDAEA